MASAISYMSASVPLPLRAFTPMRMKRQLSGSYPFVGSILSMLAEKITGFIFRVPNLNSIPVIAHLPVHVSRPHSFVKENGIPRCMARERALWINPIQGDFSRV